MPIREKSKRSRELAGPFSESTAKLAFGLEVEAAGDRELIDRGSDLVIFGAGWIEGEQRDRMAAVLAQRLNAEGVAAGPPEPVARVSLLMRGEAGRIGGSRERGESLANPAENTRKIGTRLDIANHALGAEHQSNRLLVELAVTARGGFAAEAELAR